ncbi:MAG: MFS transporter [Propionicimonas sp.]|nr:MFS transporter [Propionicimonas sp.]
MTASDNDFPWRSVVTSIFLPTLLFSIGEGAILPILPVVASQLGSGLAGAGLIAAMVVVGELVGDVPAGAIVSRVGERVSMIGAALLASIGVGVSLAAATPWVLGVGIFLIGLATSVFALARHAFMTSYVPLTYRARALSTLGGTFRLGYLIGPFLTAAVVSSTGEASSAFWIQLAGCAGTGIVLLLLRDPEASLRRPTMDAIADPGATELAAESRGLLTTIRANGRVLATVGTGSALVAALRASRQVLLPLWAVSIGLGETSTAVIIGIAGAVDFALFYAGGWIMDRFGRQWVAVPSMVGLGIGHLVLAATHDLPAPVAWFVAVAMFLSLANGIGAGMLMTIGADLADPADPAPFLGAWRFTNDSGAALAPLVISGVTALASLPAAAAVLGLMGLGGAAILRRHLPRYSTKP